MATLSQKETALKGVLENKTYREIASDMDRSVRWAFQVVEELVTDGLVEKEPGKARSTKLTPKGEQYMKANYPGLLRKTATRVEDIFPNG